MWLEEKNWKPKNRKTNLLQERLKCLMIFEHCWYFTNQVLRFYTFIKVSIFWMSLTCLFFFFFENFQVFIWFWKKKIFFFCDELKVIKKYFDQCQLFVHFTSMISKFCYLLCILKVQFFFLSFTCLDKSLLAKI